MITRNWVDLGNKKRAESYYISKRLEVLCRMQEEFEKLEEFLNRRDREYLREYYKRIENAMSECMQEELRYFPKLEKVLEKEDAEWHEKVQEALETFPVVAKE